MTTTDTSDSEVEIISGPSPCNPARSRTRTIEPCTDAGLPDQVTQRYQQEALKESHVAVAEKDRLFCGICDVWIQVTSPSDWFTCWKRHCAALDHLRVLNRLTYEQNVAKFEEERRMRSSRHASFASDVFPGIGDILASSRPQNVVASEQSSRHGTLSTLLSHSKGRTCIPSGEQQPQRFATPSTVQDFNDNGQDQNATSITPPPDSSSPIQRTPPQKPGSSADRGYERRSRQTQSAGNEEKKSLASKEGFVVPPGVKRVIVYEF